MQSEDLPHEDQPTSETDPRFPSGSWEGFFVQFGRQFRMDVELHFQRLNSRGGHVCGDGVDTVGSFRMIGSYNLDTTKVTLQKQYVGQHTVEYEGDHVASGPMLKGRWDIRSLQLSDHWRLWPVEAEEEEWELESVEVYGDERAVVFTGWNDFDQHLTELANDDI